jgi:glucose/arabinose dehydrogenase
MRELLSFATLALLTIYSILAVSGVLLIIRRRGAWRITGIVLTALAALCIALQVALSTLSPGVGEPFIRIRFTELLVQVGGGMLAVAVAAALTLWLLRRLDGWLISSRRRGLALTSLLLALPLVAAGTMYGMVYVGTPERERERDPRKREIALPPGFTWSIFARSTEWDNPTVMTFGPDGKLYVGDINGTLWRVSEPRGANETAQIERLLDGFQLLLGLAWYQDELFVSSQSKIEALRDTTGDGQFDQRRTLVDNLPAMILRPHSNNSIVIGPDERIYFGVGSTTAGEYDPEPLASAVLSIKPDGSDLRVFARGFGNPFAVAFNSEGQLFGGDNGSRDAPDEFNHIAEGEHYGFPYFQGDPPNGATTGPIATFPPHSAPTGVTFYSGTVFPADYYDSAFIALWARGEIQHVQVARTTSGAYLSRTTTFGSGFLSPISVINGPNGELYVADFGTSAIYKIEYNG